MRNRFVVEQILWRSSFVKATFCLENVLCRERFVAENVLWWKCEMLENVM